MKIPSAADTILGTVLGLSKVKVPSSVPSFHAPKAITSKLVLRNIRLEQFLTYTVPNSEYINETSHLGTIILNLVPKYNQIYSKNLNPNKITFPNGFKEACQTIEVEPLVPFLIGANFIQDPYMFMNLLESPPSAPTRLPEPYLHYESNELVLPSLKGPEMVSPAVSPIAYGVYKALIKRALLLHGYNDKLYKLLTCSQYTEFLIDTTGFPKQSRDKSNFTTQFSRYFLSCLKNNDLVHWSNDHVKCYRGLLEGVGEYEREHFFTLFRKYLTDQVTSLDETKESKLWDKIKAIYVPETQKNKELEQLGFLYVRYKAYERNLTKTFNDLFKDSKRIFHNFEKRPELLTHIGALVYEDKTQDANKIIASVIGYRKFDLSKLKHPLFPPHKNKLLNNNLALVNMHAAYAFLKAGPFDTRQNSVLINQIKNLAALGSSYFRFICRKLEFKEGIEGLERVMTLKLFKGLVYGVEGDNVYMKLKYGQAGFDQLIGVLSLSDVAIIEAWIVEVVENGNASMPPVNSSGKKPRSKAEKSQAIAKIESTKEEFYSRLLRSL